MPVDPSRVVGYTRVSTDRQGESGAGLTAQEDTIRREVDNRGWHLVGIHRDVASGSSRKRRPELAAAIERIAAGDAGTLMVSKLDRLSRSTADFAALMEEARAGAWNIVVIDFGLDLATPHGEMVANMLASIAQWERRMISLRTKEALAVKRAKGQKLGRPVMMEAATEGMITVLRRSGMGLRGIARQLNELGVPTAQGGKIWHASSVRAILERLERGLIDPSREAGYTCGQPPEPEDDDVED